MHLVEAKCPLKISSRQDLVVVEVEETPLLLPAHLENKKMSQVS